MTEISAYQVSSPRFFEEEYKVPTGIVKFAVYVMSLFLPFGLVAGMFYSTKPGDQSRLFGRNCLVLSITPILVVITIAVITFLTMAVIYGLKY